MSNAAFVGAVLSLATSGTPPPVSESPIDAPIVAVTVFGDRARVTRARQQASWPAGRLVLPRLPAGADPDSVRLEVRGPGVRLDWVTVNKLRPEDVPAAAAAATIAALDRLDRELTRAKAQAGLLERLLGATASASGEQSSSEDDDAAEDASLFRPGPAGPDPVAAGAGCAGPGGPPPARQPPGGQPYRGAARTAAGRARRARPGLDGRRRLAGQHVPQHARAGRTAPHLRRDRRQLGADLRRPPGPAQRPGDGVAVGGGPADHWRGLAGRRAHRQHRRPHDAGCCPSCPPGASASASCSRPSPR